ncbi:MAG: hypothetical protein HYW26_04100 [Candidatus Aenigmarchaeota archaeon]|nr:hypothetical protein [Candidatus Aenigmarchaeota archaeon]
MEEKEEKHQCSECGKEFSAAEGLAQHMRDKHSAMTSHELKEQRKKEREDQLKKEKDKSERSKLTRKILIVGGAFLLLSGLIYAFLVLSKGGGESRLADEEYILRTNLRTHSGVSMHIHPHLIIIANNENVNIPAEIGIEGGIMRVIHTHDATGTIHLESPVPKDFTLGQFFFVWSRTSGEPKVFNSSCILSYCNNGTKAVKMFVNGKESDEYENYIMHDLDRIEIRYE